MFQIHLQHAFETNQKTNMRWYDHAIRRINFNEKRTKIS
jgi:hypothetical protein